MKGALSAILIALVIVIAALLFFKKDGKEPGTEPGTEPFTELSIVAELPEETSALFMAPSLEKWYTLLQLKENSILGYPLEDAVEEMKEELGINLFDLAELTELGIDIRSEIGVYATDLSKVTEPMPKGVATVFVPITKESKLRSTLEKKLEEGEVPLKKEKGYTLVCEEGEDIAMIIAEKGNYAFFFIGVDSAQVVKEYELLMNGTKKLNESNKYSKAIKNIGGTGTLFMYVDLETIMPAYSGLMSKYADILSYSMSSISFDSEKLEELMKGFEAFAIWLDIDKKDFVIRSSGTVDPKSKVASYIKTNTIKSPAFNITKKPVLLYSQSLSFKEYIDEYLKVYGVTSSQVDQFFNEIAKEMEMDLKSPLYDNLGDNGSIAIYDAETINIGTYNVFLSLAVKDEKVAQEFITKVGERVKAELAKASGLGQMGSVEDITIGKTKVTKLDFAMAGKVFLGVHNKNMIITSERNLFKEAVSGSTDAGFINTLSDKDLKKAFGASTNSVAVLDIHGVATVVENFKATIAMTMSAMDPQASKKINKIITDVCAELRKIQYLLGYSTYNNSVLYSEFRIQTQYDKPFIEGTKELVENMKKIFEDNM